MDEDGRAYYQKWQNFGRYISTSPQSKTTRPSRSRLEHYLVYATALGIADKVEKVLKSAIPEGTLGRSRANTANSTICTLWAC